MSKKKHNGIAVNVMNFTQLLVCTNLCKYAIRTSVYYFYFRHVEKYEIIAEF